ncbi:hypothetical protein ACIP02_01150 [Pseudomonas sp. NPDC089408]|uniref:hypothetical protein n=1 Tax=Pseudomonas sp. NPDC089408 TaxID=3364465 RepID=UPI00380A110E
MQLLLRTALLRGLPLQGLDKEEQTCLRRLVAGGEGQPSVFVVQAEMGNGSLRYRERLSNLLVIGESDTRPRVLWCAPSGFVRSFASLSAFGKGLRDELAQRYSFDSLNWTRCAVEGNVFAQQVSLLLDGMFERIDLLRHDAQASSVEVEQAYAQLSDPAAWFVRYEDDTAAVAPPPGIAASAPQDSFACRAALLQLALHHMDADGMSALDGIQPLTEYASQQLSERIARAYGDDSSPDDLLLDLYLARGVPGGAATGAGGGEPLVFVGSKTLTQFAIGNLASLKGAFIKRTHRRNGAAGPAWLTANSAAQLVSEMDIGGRYPAYVAAQLNDAAGRTERVRRFAKEWRSALLASALTGLLDKKVSETGLQCVVDFCAGHVDPQTPRVSMFPLAFRRSATTSHADAVRGMYVLFCAEPRRVLLYRPLYRQDTVREYASLDALLEHVRDSPLLQESILDWMAPEAQSTYQDGGFTEPHIVSLGIDPYALPERPGPAMLDIKLWRRDLDEHFYKDNADLLIELADLQSMSTAESRWALLCEGAWLLFNVATLLVRGPVATAAWLVQLLTSLQHDLTALEQGGDFDRPAAVADLLLNLSMVLLHAHQPRGAAAPKADPLTLSYEGSRVQTGAFSEVAVKPTEQPPATFAGQAVDFSWRGQQGFNWLPPAQRQQLQAMHSSVSVNGLRPLPQGVHAGLYRIEGNHYVAMAGDVYRVQVLPGGVRVTDGKGTPGPWITFADDAWRVDTALRLAGGAPTGKARVAARFNTLHEQVSRLDLEIADVRLRVAEAGADVVSTGRELEAVQRLRRNLRAQIDSAPVTDDLARLQSLAVKYDEKIASLNALIVQKRELSATTLEAAVRKGQERLALLSAMGEGKYATLRKAGRWEQVLEQHQATTRVDLIRDSQFIFNEFQILADYPQLGVLQENLDGQPIAEVGEQYAALRERLAIVADYQDRMLAMCSLLDDLLAKSPDELVITSVIPEQQRTVGQLIRERKFTTVQLRFHQIQNLADLALHLDAAYGQQALSGYRDELVGLSLRNAADAHGELDLANLSTEDRVVILQEAWDEYSAALVDSARILRDGGELIEPGMLERYRQHVEQLKLDAGQRLVAALQRADAGGAGRRVPYLVSSEQQRVVRNHEGQLMIGTQVEIEGQPVVEVREAFSEKLLAIFDRVQGQWVQRVSQRPSVTEEDAPGDLPMWVQTLLEQSHAVRAKVSGYIQGDIKAPLVIQAFDQQLAKLDQAAGVVRDARGNDALIRALEREADTLRHEKKLQLTMLYTDTNYPTAAALRFLHDEGLIRVEYIARQTMQDGGVFDEYRVLRLPSNRNLWAAHFHLPSPDAFPEDFTVGHLKTWSQRRMSSQQAAVAGVRLHRGRLTLDQARGIIPFR